MTSARDCPSPKWFLLLTFASLACPFTARALDLALKLEPGVAIPLTAPQTDRFKPGGAASLKGLVGSEGSWVNVAVGLTFVGLPAESGFASSDAGTAWAPSLGLRFQSAREGARPWLDGDVHYVRTDALNRAGVSGALGVSFPIGEARSFSLGPFVRYFQIFQQERAGFDTRDAKTLIAGVSLEWRKARPPAVEPVAVAAAAPSDRDGDGVLDDADACPDVRGPASNTGCPVYEKVIVTPEKLELKEKIQFPWDRSVIDPASYPALDEVAKALQENRSFRVAIEGHASSEGADDHNQSLSERRAEAVLAYIASKGVARDRLASQGFSSSRPLEANVTESGREANRRVEFVVHFIIVKK
jgi:outer membrane protein OmpA-like peptidoglycan-associated protein